jgi:uncharacterized membrane protein YkvA (DUF1232 family)
MSELKITFKLGEKDVSYLRKVLRQAGAAAKDKSEQEIIQAGTRQAREARAASPPQYVLDRVEKLETILATVEDKDWNPPASVRKKILTALAYFSDPVDLIPDRVPGLGFLDDAIMIELIAQDMKHEIKFYHQFRTFRESAEQRPWTVAGGRRLDQRLVEKRKELRAKIEASKARDAERAKAGGAGIFRW